MNAVCVHVNLSLGQEVGTPESAETMHTWNLWAHSRGTDPQNVLLWCVHVQVHKHV